MVTDPDKAKLTKALIEHTRAVNHMTRTLESINIKTLEKLTQTIMQLNLVLDKVNIKLDEKKEINNDSGCA